MPCYTLNCSHRIFVSNAVPAQELAITCPECQLNSTVDHHTYLDAAVPKMQAFLAPKSKEEVQELRLEAALDQKWSFGGDCTDFKSYLRDFDCVSDKPQNWTVLYYDFLTPERQPLYELDLQATNLLMKSGFIVRPGQGNHIKGTKFRNPRMPKSEGLEPEEKVVCKDCGKKVYYHVDHPTRCTACFKQYNRDFWAVKQYRKKLAQTQLAAAVGN